MPLPFPRRRIVIGSLRGEPLEPRRVLTSLAGTVFEDADGSGLRDVGEPGLPGVIVYLDANDNGRWDEQGFGWEPDHHAAGAPLDVSAQGISLSVAGVDNRPQGRVRAQLARKLATTGDHVFGTDSGASWEQDRRFRIDFVHPVKQVSLDAMGADSTAATDVVLEAYGQDDRLLLRTRADDLSNLTATRLELAESDATIHYVVARVEGLRGAVTFDHLRVDDDGERFTLTAASGFYRFVDLAEGAYVVAQQLPDGYSQLLPNEDAPYHVDVEVGALRSGLNFGNRTASIEGVAFLDRGTIGVYEPSTDDVLAGTTLFLDQNGNGSPDPISIAVKPDAFRLDQALRDVSTWASLSVTDGQNQSTPVDVVAGADADINPDGQLFAADGDTVWTSERRLRVDFSEPAREVAIDYIAGETGEPERGVLVGYSPSGEEVARVATPPLANGQSTTLRLEAEGFDFQYAVAYAEGSQAKGRLDHLRATVATEPTVTTGEDGVYVFKPLTAGAHQILPLPTSDQAVTFPAAGAHREVLRVGDRQGAKNFGFVIGNLPPKAVSDTVTTTEEGAAFINVFGNDEDPDGNLDYGSLEVARPPRHGTVEVVGENLVYMPDPDFAGSDTILYTIRDDKRAVSNTAAVTVTVIPVNDAPRVRDDTIGVVGQSVTVVGVLKNDHDVDSRLLPGSVTVVDDPAHGAAKVDPQTGNIEYRSASGKADRFTYVVEDEQGLTSPVATVFVEGLAEGRPPIAVDDKWELPEGKPASLDILQNDQDDGALDLTSVVLVTPPTHGVATVTAAGKIDYRPALGFVGTDLLRYLVRDDVGLGSNVADVILTLTARDFPYQNPVNRLDTNADGFVIPRDALLIINEISQRRVSDPHTGAIVREPDVGEPPLAYFDVSGDGYIAARDVLLVINRLNRESSAEVSASPAIAALAWSQWDDEEERTSADIS